MFFLKGESMFGWVEDMIFIFVNFRDEEVGFIIEIENREIVFNFKNYIEVYKVKIVWLYLCFKCNDVDCELLFVDDVCDSDDDLIFMWEFRDLVLIGFFLEWVVLR